MKLRIPKAAFALLLTLSGWANGVPVPILDVPSLAAASDLIVVGKVESTRDGGATSIDFGGNAVAARLVLCVIEVDNILKGTVEGRTISLRYVLPSEPIGYASVVPGYQMLFLKKSDLTYLLASPYHASLPAVPDSGVGQGDLLSKIAECLGSVLRASATSHAQKQTALYALSTVHTLGSTDLLRQSLQQRDPTLRLNAAGFLLLRDDLTGMSDAEKAILQPEGLPGNLIHNLNYAIAEGVKDKNAVPALNRLARVQELETRRAAAAGLRHVGSKSAIPSLVHLLDDNDQQVRHEAIMGLAEITGDLDWGPNLDLFQSQEQTYLKHWHDWASANGFSK